MSRRIRRRGSITESVKQLNHLHIAPQTEKDVDYYFESYSRLSIHEAMLKDRVRTLAYRDAIMTNRHLFKDKVVLDVGCGTGILSMFAAKAGAATVFAVDCASIIEKTRQVIEDNNFGGTIHLVKGQIELVKLPVKRVDIIISEWMGYCLLFESMLDSVLFARDKWLRPGGLMFPDHCSLFVVGLKMSPHQHDSIEFWSNVYNFDMSPMRELALKEARFKYVYPEHIVTDAFQLKTLDLYKVTRNKLDFNVPFKLTMEMNDNIQALATYFTVEFRCCHTPITLSTSPLLARTHWKQTVFYLNDKLVAKSKEVIYGTFRLKKNETNQREMDVSFDLCYYGFYGTFHRTQLNYHVR